MPGNLFWRASEAHAKQAVELRAFHDLAKQENILGRACLVAGSRKVEVAPQLAGIARDEMRLALDGLMSSNMASALVRVDAEGRNHVHQRVGVNIFLMGMAAQDELDLRRSDDSRTTWMMLSPQCLRRRKNTRCPS